MARDLNKFFRNPPQGGNGVGVRTQNPMTPNPRPCGKTESYYLGGGGKGLKEQRERRMLENMSPEERSDYQMREWTKEPPPGSGPGAQTSLRESFEAGELSARQNSQQSTSVGQNEFRNWDRGRIPAQTASDPSGLSMYDYESAQAGFTGRAGDGQAAGGSNPQPNPRMSSDADTNQTYRSDGKPFRPMPGGNNT